VNFTPKMPFQVAGFQSDFDVESHPPTHNDHAGTISVPSAYLLFSGDYSRSGVDLILIEGRP
jgi:hypothetical protein